MTKSIIKNAVADSLTEFRSDGSGTINQTVTPDAVAAQITNWLGQLRLLHNVPFRYLVPDERMLPPESIRFFNIDNNWLDVLVDGAYSIGRYTNGLGDDNNHLSNKVEGAFADMVHAGANMAVRNIRPAIFKAAASTDNSAFDTATGFLLRSEVVKGWPGLQAVGYERGHTPNDPNWQGEFMTMLRLERLSDEILLGIFEGPLYRLDIHEPSEGLHFGFDSTDVNGIDQLSKNLRNPADGSTLSGVSISPQDMTDHKVFRNNDPTQNNQGGQVVNMYNMSALMFSKLTADKVGYQEPAAQILVSSTPTLVSNLTSDMHPLASSDFALQMVEGVGMVSFFNAQPGDTTCG